jgi:hypothetical protein
MLSGVIKEAEKYIQGVEQFISGSKKMENFKEDMKSIISTLIKQMTELKISNVCFAGNIDCFTEESEKTIKLLEELSIEDVKNVSNIKCLIIFGNELLELLEDIVRIVLELQEKNGLKKIENTSMPICENIKEITRFAYVAKASRSERNMGCEEIYTLKNDVSEDDIKKIKHLLSI